VVLVKLFANGDDVRAHRQRHYEPRRVSARW
jgi:hypothetical protein